MRKLIATAIVVTLATLGAAGSASALPNKDVLDALLNSLKKGHKTESTSPGDAFYPATPDSDRRAACEEAGGSVEGTRREWVCVF